ncbi:IS110 family transposase [Negadavirga shengliensis]|uniref:Transposase n=1 Tax=Negadavirga shengliensis TaxID=1389218 RepID=A0ABV9TAX2_9BACT
MVAFLDGHNLFFTLIPGLELKKSLDIRRGKSDKADSRDIAGYIYEKREKIKCIRMPSKNLDQLRRLASYRERLSRKEPPTRPGLLIQPDHWQDGTGLRFF